MHACFCEYIQPIPDAGWWRIVLTKSPPQKLSNQGEKSALNRRKSPLPFSFRPIELAKEPQLEAEMATVATQLWPFRKPG